VQDCLRTSSFSENNVVFYLLSDGYVKGIDNGEWGGRLVFFPTDVRENEYIIINDNIIAIFSINNNIYVLGGTSHQGVSMGHIYKLYKKNGKWNSYEVLDLKDKPYAYVINNYELYIVTYSKLMRIVNERIKDIIVENAFWQSLYPNSIVVFKNNAIIGMRGGITTVNLENKEIISFEKQ